jgi:hypothetical protein
MAVNFSPESGLTSGVVSADIEDADDEAGLLGDPTRVLSGLGIDECRRTSSSHDIQSVLAPLRRGVLVDEGPITTTSY